MLRTATQDVLVLGTSALQPGAIVDIRPLGYMVMGEARRGRFDFVSVMLVAILINTKKGPFVLCRA